MRSRISTRIAIALCLLGGTAVATPLLAQSELNGVWTFVEVSGHNTDGEWEWNPVQPSLYIFMDGYYSMVQVNGNEPRPLMPDGTTWDNMTEEQFRSVCSTAVFSANSGTYEVSGSSLTTKPMVAKWPAFMEGGSASFSFSVKDDVLTLMREGDGWSRKAELQRLR